jgi:hypothetical protein
METTNGDNHLFSATLGFESYAPRIQAPLLWLGSTNDFYGIMDARIQELGWQAAGLWENRMAFWQPMIRLTSHAIGNIECILSRSAFQRRTMFAPKQ